MKKKRMIWTYGTVLLPVDVGKQVRYFQNGALKVTGKVLRVLEQREDRIKFETEQLRYCISFHNAQEMEMVMAA